MKVTVIDRDTMRKMWGTGTYSLIARNIEISDNCDICGDVDKYSDLLKRYGTVEHAQH